MMNDKANSFNKLLVINNELQNKMIPFNNMMNKVSSLMETSQKLSQVNGQLNSFKLSIHPINLDVYKQTLSSITENHFKNLKLYQEQLNYNLRPIFDNLPAINNNISINYFSKLDISKFSEIANMAIRLDNYISPLSREFTKTIELIDFSKHPLTSSSFSSLSNSLVTIFNYQYNIDDDFESTVGDNLNLALNYDLQSDVVSELELPFIVIDDVLKKLNSFLRMILQQGKDIQTSIESYFQRNSNLKYVLLLLISQIGPIEFEHAYENLRENLFANNVEEAPTNAIIVASEVILKTAPHHKSADVCIINAGTEIIEVSEEKDNWVKISFIDQTGTYQTGWILKDRNFILDR